MSADRNLNTRRPRCRRSLDSHVSLDVASFLRHKHVAQTERIDGFLDRAIAAPLRSRLLNPGVTGFGSRIPAVVRNRRSACTVRAASPCIEFTTVQPAEKMRTAPNNSSVIWFRIIRVQIECDARTKSTRADGPKRVVVASLRPCKGNARIQCGADCCRFAGLRPDGSRTTSHRVRPAPRTRTQVSSIQVLPIRPTLFGAFVGVRP